MINKILSIVLIFLLITMLISFIITFNGNILKGIIATGLTMGCVNGFLDFMFDTIRVFKKIWR